MYPFKLLSHPDRLLKDHIQGVYRTAMYWFDTSRFDLKEKNKQSLRNTIQVATLFHDFGKATPWFQEYISNINEEKQQTSAKRNLRRHSLISAVFTFYILSEILEVQSKFALYGFIIVLKHHGNLENFDDLLTVVSEDIELMNKQSQAINYEEYQQMIGMEELKPVITKKTMNHALQEQGGVVQKLRKLRRKQKPLLEFKDYYTINWLYSLLLSADKWDAVFRKTYDFDDSFHLSAGLLKSYKDRIFGNSQSQIKKLRDFVFDGVRQNLYKKPMKSRRIFSINTPTGSGKTLAALHAALIIKEKLELKRIIYCLPFTSIIDQNFKVFESVFKDIVSGDHKTVTSEQLLKHHHLADLTYQSLEDNGDGAFLKTYTPHQAQQLIEGWESHFVVTTFVQLMHSMVSQANGSLRKFHKFSEAVIILDEIQSIPHAYWKLTHDILNMVARLFNSSIILVTATMPLIFSEEQNEIEELVPQKKELYQSLSRIDLDLSPLWTDNDQLRQLPWLQFLDEVLQLIKMNNNRSILIVMNTIQTARQLFDYLKEYLSSHEFRYLSSHVLPLHRLKVIDEIKNNESELPFLLVSTQLVEAGVDLDFDLVIRDFAPLDNIFQVCGRCNRNSDSDRGRALLYYIYNEQGRRPASIYDSFLLEKTLTVLRGSVKIEERDFFTLAQKYFEEVKTFHSERKSKNILEALKRLNYETAIKDEKFRLIDDNYSDPVFIEWNNEAKELWEAYEALLNELQSFEKRTLAKQLKNQLANYIINIPKKNFPAGYNDAIYHLSIDNVNEFYNEETGYDTDQMLPMVTQTVTL